MEQKREDLSPKILERLDELFRCLHQNVHGRHNRMHTRHNEFMPFSDLKLSRRQIFFLFIVAKSKEGISVKDLARFSRVTSGAVTQFIDILIEKKLVKREADPQDRRALKIKLTDYARSRFDNFKKGYFNSISPAFKNLTTEELNTLFYLLEKVEPSEQNSCSDWSK